jgi:hypothetical protein
MASRLWLLGLVGSIALTAVFADSASASTVTITLEEAGFATQTIPGISGAGSVGVSGVSYGTFQLNNISGTASPLVSDALDSNSFNLASTGTGANTLTVLVTATGLTQPTSAFISSLTQNSLSTGTTVTESTFLDLTNNGLLTTLLGTSAFTTSNSPGTSVQTSFTAASGTYSITEEYVISVTGGGQSANSTIQVAVPEASTWAMIILGFFGVGFVSYRRKSGPSFRFV